LNVGKRIIATLPTDQMENLTPVLRHVCGYCAPGYGALRSPENPAKTDWCAMCQHRGEGLLRETYRHKWGGYRLTESLLTPTNQPA
jgi:hypothetical protein